MISKIYIGAFFLIVAGYILFQAFSGDLFSILILIIFVAAYMYKQKKRRSE